MHRGHDCDDPGPNLVGLMWPRHRRRRLMQVQHRGELIRERACPTHAVDASGLARRRARAEAGSPTARSPAGRIPRRPGCLAGPVCATLAQIPAGSWVRSAIGDRTGPRSPGSSRHRRDRAWAVTSSPTWRGRSRSAGSIRPIRSASRSTSPTGSSSASGWRITSGPGVCFWHSFAWPGVGHVRHRDARPAVARPARATRWTPRGRRWPSPSSSSRSSASRTTASTTATSPRRARRFAEFRGEPRRAGRRCRRLPGADRRPAAVGHGQPVHPPALPGRCGHEPRSRGLRLRRRAGQAHARGDAAARRRELRPVGRPRGLRHAAQHGPRAARAPSSPGSCTWSPSTSTRSASRASC